MKFRHIRLLVLVTIIASAASLVPPVLAPYRDYQYLMADFVTLAEAYPGLVTCETIGKTVQSKDIIMFKIGNPYGGRALFDGAMHGDETLGPELLYLYTNWLLTSNEPLAQRILSRTCTMIIPALNVDRYNRARKNSNGVDLNRNFATNWGSAGSTDPDSFDYRGPAPLSEPESQTLVQVFQAYQPHFYVNLHMWASPYYAGSSYGNRTLYSLLKNKIDSLSYERGVTPFSYSGQFSGAGFAISDAARVGVTSYLIELALTAIPYTDIEPILLPRFIPLAAVLSLEYANQTFFEDGFESGNFVSWSGTTVSSGGYAAVENTHPFEGTYNAEFRADGISSGTRRAFAYREFSGSTVYARAYFNIAEGLPLIDTDDRFTPIQFLSSSGSIISNLQIRHVQGEDRFTVFTSTNMQTTTSVYPQPGRWYCLELHTRIHSTEGSVKAYIDGVEHLSLTNINTAELGNVAFIRFGLANTINTQNGVVLRVDCAVISTSYIGESARDFPPWDVDQDGKTDIYDAVIVASAYWSTPESSNWDPRADVDSNGIVNIYDLTLVTQHYSEVYTSDYVLLMPFDLYNSTTATDYSGCNNHGEITGATWTSRGIIGGAYEFDGNDVITIQDNPTLDGGGAWSELTVEFWLKPTALLRGTRIVAKKAASDSTGSYMVGFQTSTSEQPNTLFFGITTNGNWEEVVLRSKTLSVGAWHHVVCTYESGPGLTIYINGTQAANRPLTGTIDRGTGDEPLFLGYDGEGDAGRYLVGLLDEVKISSTVTKLDSPTYSAFH